MSESYKPKFTEIEVKYRADKIGVADFKLFCENFGPEKYVHVSGPDVYYSGPGQAFEFLRHRVSDDGSYSEVTTKVKTSEKNNNERHEVDLKLKSPQREVVETFAKGLGFTKNFTIHKDCHIYQIGKITVVLYDVIHKEAQTGDTVARFIEIEIDKKGTYASEEEAWAILTDFEKNLAIFGITAQNRLRKSLWEMYRV